jgi:hypothetical protein
LRPSAKERLSTGLDELARSRPEVAASIKQELEQFESDATQRDAAFAAETELPSPKLRPLAASLIQDGRIE